MESLEGGGAVIGHFVQHLVESDQPDGWVFRLNYPLFCLNARKGTL